jgi:hypothetical protein
MACRALLLFILNFIHVCRVFGDLQQPQQERATTLEDYIFMVIFEYRVAIPRVKTKD